MAENKRTNWKLILNIVTIVALIGLIYAVRDQIKDTITNLSNVNPGALLLMIPAQMLNYHAFAIMYLWLFDVLGEKIKYGKMLVISLELNFVNNVFPSGGVSGFSYFGLRMKSQGVSTGKATLVQLMRFILLFISFQILLFIGLILLAFEGKASGFLMLVAGSLTTLLLVGTIAAGFIVGSQKRINSFFGYITKAINRAIHIFRPNHPETISTARVERTFTELHENYLIFKDNPKILQKPLIWSLVANVAEILTVYVVYIAFGEWVNPGAIIIAYAVANFAGLVSVLPGGVGIYEALMTAILVSAGIPPGLSIPVTIMYRILNMALQLPSGYYFYHRALRETPSFKKA